MYRLMSRLSVLLVLLGMTLFALPQPGEAVTISNGEFVVHSLPGQSVSSSFTIGNNEDEALVVDIRPIDWHRDEFGSLVFLEANTHERSIAAWLTQDVEQIVLGPEDNQEINFTVNTPVDVSGSYWGGFIAEVRSESDLRQEEDGVGVAIATKFLIKIFVDIGVGIQSQGNLIAVEELGLNPLTIEVALHNSGNARFEAVKGRVEIRDLTGQTIRSMPIRELTLLPGDTRKIKVVDEAAPGDMLAPGRYLALAILDLGLPNLLGGQLIFEIKELALEPLDNASNLPQDLDFDGFYEDVNGDGTFDQNDVLLFEAHFEDDMVQRNWRAFDFNNNGVVDRQDFRTLRDLLDEDSN